MAHQLFMSCLESWKLAQTVQNLAQGRPGYEPHPDLGQICVDDPHDVFEKVLSAQVRELYTQLIQWAERAAEDDQAIALKQQIDEYNVDVYGELYHSTSVDDLYRFCKDGIHQMLTFDDRPEVAAKAFCDIVHVYCKTLDRL
eukprot:SAG11_NODE_18844_length_480_cov_0.724409_1_plen_141_part_10